MKILPFIVVLLLSSFSSLIYANLADSFYFSAPGVATAGARVSQVNDFTSAYYNMAGLTSVVPPWYHLNKPAKPQPVIEESIEPEETSEKVRLEKRKKEPPAIRKQTTESMVGFGYLYQLPMMTLNLDTAKVTDEAVKKDLNKSASQATSNLNYGTVQLGFAFDLRSIVNSPLPLKLGGAIALRDNGNLAQINDTTVKSYNFQKLGAEAERFVLISGLSSQVIKNRLSIGAGASLSAGGEGKFKMTDVIIDPSGETQVPRQEVILKLTPAMAPVAGVQYAQAIDRHVITAGLSYRGELMIEMTPLEASATTSLLQIDLPLELAVRDFYTPHIINGGATFFYKKHIAMSLEIEYQMWSKFKNSAAREKYETFDTFKDIIVPKLGFEMPLAKEWLIRSGYSYVPAFTPEQSGLSNYLDNNKHILGAGFSYVLSPNFLLKQPTVIDFGLQAQLWQSRSTEKKDTSDPYSVNYDYSGMIIIASVSAHWRF